ncbi:class I SAM-dependent rRNA methyltransferase [Desulfovibrio inopinatus]|uniref:class I SAM-dependent rRNA methyltransferase n=1 Tax=Desulfovibrio inopinatus TaxID=102109 RepID=UPI0003F90D6E|nr:class I SAM-dependent rRNA methyltransferase [Desulfovibrio inopinatus]
MKRLYLRKGEDRRLRAGHLWVFSNEVDTTRSPLADFAPGDEALIMAASGRPLGVGYVNPGALICARIVGYDEGDRLDEALIARRIASAVSLRQRFYRESCYRLVYGEGDFLPGLVVDRFNDVFVLQATTAGIERRIDLVTSVLVDMFAPRAVLAANDAAVRSLEGLEREREHRDLYGEAPEKLVVNEAGAEFMVDAKHGQKTGWFFDMRDNRLRLAGLCREKRVLDLYSYAGAFGIQAGLAGAAEVICVDSSPLAVAAIRENAVRNGASTVTAQPADVEDALNGFIDAGEQFDVICLDPPAFVKRKKDFKKGLVAYERVNRLAMECLTDDAILMSCSCSSHVSDKDLRDVARKAGINAGRSLQMVYAGGQGPDHPVHPAMDETRYLKALVFRVHN